MKYVKTFENFESAYKQIRPDDRIIMSADANLEPKSVKQKADRFGTFKPLGLWYSIGTEWIDWVESSMPKWKNDHIYRIDLDMSNVLRLKVDMTVEKFEEKFGITNPMLRRNVVTDIDWNAVEREGWHGIEIHDPYGEIGSWLRTWDISSGCIWNKDAIKKIDKLI